MKKYRNLPDMIEFLKGDIALLDGVDGYEEEVHESKHELAKCITRKDVTDWMKGLGIRYHVTITFNYNLREDRAEEFAKKALRMVSNEYFGKRLSYEYCFAGVAVREYQANGTVHYHMLISDHPVFGWKRNRKKYFDSVWQEKCFRLKKSYFNKNGVKKEIRPIDIFTGLKIQDYFDEKLEEYLTKCLEKNPYYWDFLAPIDMNGFVFENKSYDIPFANRNLSGNKETPLNVFGGMTLGNLKAFLRGRNNGRRFIEKMERRKNRKPLEELPE